MAVGFAIAAGITVASTIMSMRSQKKAAEAEAAAARQSAENKRLAALEIFERFKFNAAETRKGGEKFKGSQTTTFIASGKSSSSKSLLDILEDTEEAINTEVKLQRMEADLQTKQLFASADLDQQLAGNILRSGKRERIATALSGATSLTSTAIQSKFFDRQPSSKSPSSNARVFSNTKGFSDADIERT